jgi:FAD/FMN-containing dehydrogenase
MEPFVMLSSSTLDVFRRTFSGSILSIGDDGYGEARLAWNRAIDQRPALVVRSETAKDVVAAVNLARSEGLSVAVQSTGHGATSAISGAVLIDMARMDRVLVDPDRRTARFGGGARLSAVMAAAAPFGLAPVTGFARTVGATGFTLGGGLGWLARRHGYAADHVRSIEIVTADGELLRVDENTHGDLFWALRGMGRDFGVVTQVEVALHPVTTVHGGTIFMPVEAMDRMLSTYGDFTRAVSENVTSMLALYRFPDLPFLPPFLRGKPLVGFHAAAFEDAQALSQIDMMRRVATPILDTFADMPVTALGDIANDPTDPMPAYVRGFAISDWSRSLEDTLMTLAGPDKAGHFVKIELRHLGGAIAREPEVPNAVGQRDGRFLACYVAPTPAPGMMEAAVQEADRFDRALAPFRSVGPCMNFVHVREEFGGAFSAAKLDRLRMIKRRHDPANLFRFPGWLSDEGETMAVRSIA